MSTVSLAVQHDKTPGVRSRNGLNEIGRVVWWSVLTGLSLLLVYNTLPFFTLRDDVPFLLEKGHVAAQPVWRVSFHLHVAGGIVCLLAALPQFSRTMLRRLPRLHRILGYTYVSSVLVFVVPAGLYLSLHAKGGLPGRLGFLTIGFALLYTTWRGLERVRAGDFRGHVAWMVRSYAMAASALSFRVFYVGLYALDIPNEYVLGIWMSLFVNAAVAEWILHSKHPRSKGALA